MSTKDDLRKYLPNKATRDRAADSVAADEDLRRAFENPRLQEAIDRSSEADRWTPPHFEMASHPPLGAGGVTLPSARRRGGVRRGNVAKDHVLASSWPLWKKGLVVAFAIALPTLLVGFFRSYKEAASVPEASARPAEPQGARAQTTPRSETPAAQPSETEAVAPVVDAGSPASEPARAIAAPQKEVARPSPPPKTITRPTAVDGGAAVVKPPGEPDTWDIY